MKEKLIDATKWIKDLLQFIILGVIYAIVKVFSELLESKIGCLLILYMIISLIGGLFSLIMIVSL